MIPIQITTDLDRTPWEDLKPETKAQLGLISRMGRLPHGTTSGKSTVAIVVTMPDGKEYLAQTTLQLIEAAVRCLMIADSR